MEEVKFKGLYAVKVGNMWVNKNYSDYELKDTPKSLVGIKEALLMADKTGGDIYQFNPTQLTEEQLGTLRLATEASNE